MTDPSWATKEARRELKDLGIDPSEEQVERMAKWIVATLDRSQKIREESTWP